LRHCDKASAEHQAIFPGAFRQIHLALGPDPSDLIVTKTIP
jgi:hypothetical protein